MSLYYYLIYIENTSFNFLLLNYLLKVNCIIFWDNSDHIFEQYNGK